MRSAFQILLVDDDPDQLRITSRLLDKSEFVVETATNGRDCMKIITDHKPDLLLLDVVLPDANGIELCNEIKNDPSLASIYVILLSGLKTEAEHVSNGLETGADGFILKPIAKRELKARIYAAIRTINAEKALQESKLRYKFLSDQYEAILDHIPGLVFYKDKQNNLVRVNKYIAEAYQKTKSELEGKNLLELFSEDVAMRYFLDDKEVFDSGNAKLNIIEPWETAEGTRWVETSKIPFVNIQGDILGVVGISTDITERMKAESTLKESEQRFRRLMESLPIPVGLADENGVITFRNSRFIDLFGYTEKDLPTLADWWLMAYPDPEYRQWAFQNWNLRITEAAQKGTDIEPEEYHVTCKDGTVREVVIHGTLISNSCLVTFVDITQRKLAEVELHEREQMLDEAGKLARLGGWEIDLVNNKLTWTSETYRIHEVDPTYQPSLEDGIRFYAPESRPILTTAIQEAIRAGRPFDLELQFLTARGRHLWVRSIGNADQVDGKTVRLFGVFQDITEQKKVSELIQMREKQLNDLINGNQDGMLVIDQQGLVHMCNPAAAEMLQRSIEEMIGLPFGFPVNTLEAVEIELIQPGMEIRIAEMRVSEILWQGETAMLVSLRDITERKAMEQELIDKNNDLKRINAEKDKFFSVLAHDLRSPFNSFLGFTQMMEDELSALSPEQIKKIITVMRRSAVNVYSLLENLLEWSRLGHGTMVPEPTLLKISAVITNNLSAVIDLAQQKDIDLRVELDDTLTVSADEKMFGSVIRNLTSNAVKFTPRGGRILISAKSRDDGSIQISVADSGIGMSDVILENLFSLDKSINRKGTENEPSTGLGLIITKDLVEKNGGKLWADSVEGKGSVFHFTLADACLN